MHSQERITETRSSTGDDEQLRNAANIEQKSRERYPYMFTGTICMMQSADMQMTF